MEDEVSELASEFIMQLRRFKRIKPSQSMMPEGITPNEGFALKMIEICERTGKASRPGILAEHLHVTKSNASQILRSLGEKGLITREQSTEDYRVATIGLTEAGKGMIAKMDALRDQQFHQVIKDFGTDDFKVLVDLLGRYATCMENRGEVSARGARS